MHGGRLFSRFSARRTSAGRCRESRSPWEILTNETLGVFVRTTLIRTTRIGKVSLEAQRLFQPLTTRELGAVVERERTQVLVLQGREPRLDFLSHVIGRWRRLRGKDRVARGAIDPRRLAARAGRSEQRVVCAVAPPQPRLEPFRTRAISGRSIVGSRFFRRAGCFPRRRRNVRPCAARSSWSIQVSIVGAEACWAGASGCCCWSRPVIGSGGHS